MPRRPRLGTPQQRVRQTDRHLLPHGVAHLANGDGARRAQRRPVARRRSEQVEYGALPSPVGAGHPLSVGAGNQIVGRGHRVAEEGAEVGQIAAGERRRSRPAGPAATRELLHHEVDGPFRGVARRREAYAQHADQPADPVAAVVDDCAPRCQPCAVAARGGREQASVHQPHVVEPQRQVRERRSHRGEEAVELAAVERQPAGVSRVAVVARADDRAVAPRGDEEQPPTGGAGHRVGPAEGRRDDEVHRLGQAPA